MRSSSTGLCANLRTMHLEHTQKTCGNPGAGEEIRTLDIYLGKVIYLSVFWAFWRFLRLGLQRFLGPFCYSARCLCANLRTNNLKFQNLFLNTGKPWSSAELERDHA